VSIRNLDKIFRPAAVAVIGASHDFSKVGYRVLRNMIGSGFSGVVFPVNPKRESVQGIQCFPDVASLPRTPDLAVICTPGPKVPGLVRECGEAGILGVIMVAAGFSEVGDEGKALEDQIRQEVANHQGMRVIGPNCLGLMVPGIGLNASFAAGMPKGGHVAFVSQSGALCTAVLDLALDLNVGFSHFVSIGNMVDVSFADMIDYLGEQNEAHSIILYVESITHAREFMSAARAFSLTKPIVAYKAGRFHESALAAASHTGAMAGDDHVFDAVAERAGIERVYHLNDMFDCAELLSHHPPPESSRLAIVTNAGGPGVMATDTLIEQKGTLAPISNETIARLDATLPAIWSRGNPIDVGGDATAQRFAEATSVVMEDDAVDAVLVVLTPQVMTDPTETAHEVGKIAQMGKKPIIAAWMGGSSVESGVNILTQAGVPAYSTPEQAVTSFMHLVSYARNLETLYETPRDIHVAFVSDREDRVEASREIIEKESSILSERCSMDLLAIYEIDIARCTGARTAEESVAAAESIGYPVVMKICSPQITYKTDIAGVALDLRSDGEVVAAYERIMQNTRSRMPEATIEGVTVQPMLPTEEGVELILGSKKDTTFGAVIMVGMGGVSAEMYGDFALGLPPLNERLARRMLESLRSWPMLQGYRNRPAVDVDKLIETLIRFSYLVADHPAIREIDVNPLLATATDMIALGARVVLDPDLAGKDIPRYSHLAIRPYPGRYVRHDYLKSGQPVTLRPIKPEDEPMWHALLGKCSAHSLRSRFFSVFKESTHQMATRYCFIDYEREMAIVAEIDGPEGRELIGVTGLAADPDHEMAEFAILVPDPVQGEGVGNLLTDYTFEVAEEWGIKRITATMMSNNKRAIHLMRSRGFKLTHDIEERAVYAEKDLEPVPSS
jgi:acetyltransferase